jgi:hypothetical protein
LLADPTQGTWSIRLAERGRKHLEAEARQADLTFETIRRGSPHTLVATKTQRSYERRVAQRRQDLELRAQLAR